MEGLGELIKKLETLRDKLPEEAERIALAMANNHIALVVPRIRMIGISGETYSDAGVPAYFYLGFSSISGKNKGRSYDGGYASQNKAGFDRMIKKKLKDNELVSWKDVRKASGRQINFVDFSFSQRTLNNLGVVSLERSGFIAKAFIGNSNIEEANRLLYGYDRYGDFLAPNVEEQELLSSVAKQMINNVFEKYKI